MPVSKRRKKNGKVVKRSQAVRDIPDDRPVGVTLQDLINVVAYQDYVAKAKIEGAQPGDVIADDVVVHMADNIPVMVGEGEDRHQVGIASPIPGDEGAMSIHITDEEILKTIQGPVQQYSMDEEN